MVQLAMVEKRSNNIEKLRKAKGLTLEAVAAAAKTSHEQIRKLQNGERRLTHDWMVRLAPVLGVTPAELIDSNAARFPDNTTTKGGMSEHLLIEKEAYQRALIREVCSAPPEQIEEKIAKALNQYNQDFKKTTGKDPTAESVRSYLQSIKSLFVNN